MLINYAKVLVCMICALGSALLAAQEAGVYTAVSARAIPPSGEMSASGIDISDSYGRFALATSESAELQTYDDVRAGAIFRSSKKTPAASTMSNVEPLPEIDAMIPLEPVAPLP
jgi:hypothetical protein